MALSTEQIAAKAQQGVLDSIPPAWRLPTGFQPPSNVMDVPRTCGLLTLEQLRITEQTASELLGQLAKGELTSVGVTEAFLGRAAIAHQLVW